MGSYKTDIGDATILLEAPASGAFAKGGADVEASPRTAMKNIIRTISLVSEKVGEALSPTVKETGAELDVTFSVRADSYGLVMVSESSEVGQFKVKVTFKPPKAAPPRPARPPRGQGRARRRPPGAPPKGGPGRGGAPR